MYLGLEKLNEEHRNGLRVDRGKSRIMSRISHRTKPLSWLNPVVVFYSERFRQPSGEVHLTSMTVFCEKVED